MPAEPLSRAGSDLDVLFVCAGGAPADWRSAEVLACLRQLASEGVRLGGISGGPYILAAAGLMKRRRFTVHWEHAPALVEAFPDLAPEQARFVIDGDRLTCGGGIAPLDMTHALIAERMGEASRAASRTGSFTSRSALPGGRSAPRPPSATTRIIRPRQALEKMAATVEAPLPRARMARFVGVSERHLDRLFAERLGRPSQPNIENAPQHAMRLVQQSALGVSEIAFATGFSSAGHLSRRSRNASAKVPANCVFQRPRVPACEMKTQERKAEARSGRQCENQRGDRRCWQVQPHARISRRRRGQRGIVQVAWVPPFSPWPPIGKLAYPGSSGLHRLSLRLPRIVEAPRIACA